MAAVLCDFGSFVVVIFSPPKRVATCRQVKHLFGSRCQHLLVPFLVLFACVVSDIYITGDLFFHCPLHTCYSFCVAALFLAQNPRTILAHHRHRILVGKKGLIIKQI